MVVEHDPEFSAIWQDLVAGQHYDPDVVTTLYPLLTGSPSDHAKAIGFLQRQGHHGIGDPSNSEDQAALSDHVRAAKAFVVSQHGGTVPARVAEKYSPKAEAIHKRLDAMEPASKQKRHPLRQRSTLPRRGGMPSASHDPYERS